MGSFFVPKDRLGTTEPSDSEQMSYVPVVTDGVLSAVVSNESYLGVGTSVVKEISGPMDFQLGKAVERLRNGYSVEHHRGRSVPTVKLLGVYVPMVLEPKAYGCLT